MSGIGVRGAVQAVRMVVLLFWGAVWTLATLAFDGIAVHSLVELSRVQHYAATEGRVETTRKHELALRRKRRKSNSPSPPSQLKPGEQVLYRYQVQGKSYEGSQVRPAFAFSTGSHEQLLDRLKPGDRVTVYYDPQNPQQAVLDNKLRPDNFVLLLFLLPFNCIMLAVWGYLLLRKWPRAWPSLLAGLVLCGGPAFLLAFVFIPLSAQPDPPFSPATVALVPVVLVVLGAATGLLAYFRPDSIWYRMGEALSKMRPGR